VFPTFFTHAVIERGGDGKEVVMGEEGNEKDGNVMGM